VREDLEGIDGEHAIERKASFLPEAAAKMKSC
jgi:hypothetical protein